MGTEAYSDDYYQQEGSQIVPPFEVAQESEAERERKRLLEATRRINELFFRDRPIGGTSVLGGGGPKSERENLRGPIYSSVYNDVFGVQKQKIDEKAQEQQRQLGFSLSSRGLTGGSADIDSRAAEGRAYGTALQQASESAQEQSDGVRKNDEQTRLNLLSQVRSGLDSDSATNSAFEQMKNNAAVGRQDAGYGAINQYLNDVSPLFVQSQQQQGANAARSGYSSVFGVTRNNNGKVTV